ncbi:MAG: carboxypeptidase-like regulatory domain-containing protein [Planctomycetota bacterium]|nr:carboxypeptidase-like regulatory domain-containing protein [Planctomycetota bacterium]
MSRTPAILAVLAALALVLVGAWWIGSEPAQFPGAESQVDEAAEESGGAPGLEDPADAVEDPLERAVAVGVEEPNAVAPSSAGPLVEAPSPGLRVRGTLLDAATGEPLPAYTFELQDGRAKTERLVTDEHGVFSTTQPLTVGPLRARYLEASQDRVDAGSLRALGDGTAEPLDLRVASGPTFRLALTPAGVPGPDALSGRLQLLVSEGSSVARGEARVGTPPWIRIGPLPAGAQGDAELVLDSRDGVWRGRTSVRVALGIQPGILSVTMQAFSALAVHVVGGDDGAPLANAVVAWKPASGQRGRDQTTDRDGRASFDRLSAEPGSLLVRSARHLEFELPIVLLTGQRREEEVRLVRAPSAGSIRGLVFSDTGQYAERLEMRLVLADQRDGPRPLSATVAWNTEGSTKVGRFAFDDLPPGRWKLSVAEADWYEWEPRRTEVEAPLDGVQFRVHDSVPVADLVFEPVDEQGERLLDFEVRVVGGGETRVERSWKPPLILPAFPVQKSLRWRVDAAGRAAAFGDWDSLSPLVAVGGREQRGARPLLARGWAQLYRVIRSDNKKPVAGATAVVDGRESGSTDAQGRIVLRADARPARVSFRWKDWRLTDPVDLAPLRPGSNDFERTIRLEAQKNSKKKP